MRRYGLILFIISILGATTYHTVQIDGDTTDYDSDELVLRDPPDDSYWLNNEIYDFYLTWNDQNFYMACSYRIQSNALLIVIDAGRGRGVSYINDLDWYPRSFLFDGMLADVLVALWDAQLVTGGIREIVDMEQTRPLDGISIQNSATPGNPGVLEFSIPWASLYGTGGVPEGLRLKIVGLIAGSDHYIGGESAPNNESIGRGFINLINTYLEVVVDADSDGIPDNGVSPNERARIVTSSGIPLKFSSVEIPRRVVRSGDSLTVTVRLSKEVPLRVRIFNEDGYLVLSDTTHKIAPGTYSFSFKTKNGEGEYLPPGVYIMEFEAVGLLREKKAIAIVK